MIHIDELRARHLKFLADDNTSRGQREDSDTIVRLIDQINFDRGKIHRLQEMICTLSGHDWEPDTAMTHMRCDRCGVTAKEYAANSEK